MSIKPFLLYSILALTIFVNSAIVAKNSHNQLYDIAWKYLQINPDSSIYYSNLLRNHSQKNNDVIGLAKSYYIEGYSYFYKRQYDKAALKYYEGIDILKKEGKNTHEFKERLMLLFQNLGLLYELTYGYEEALKYYNEALKFAQSINSKEDIAVLYYNIGINYYHLEKFNLAEENYNNALKLYTELGFEEEVIETYNLVGVLNMKDSNFQKAKEYFNIAINLCDRNNILQNKKSWFISNLGENYFIQKQYDSAKYYYNIALSLSNQLSDFDKIEWLHNNLGDVYFQEGNYLQAIYYYEKTFYNGEKSEKTTIDKELKRASMGLALAYENIDDLNNSIKYHKQYVNQAELLQLTKNKLSEQNAQYRMKEVEWMMEKQLKEQKIHQMERVNFWFKITVSLLLLILFVSAYKAYRYYSGVQAVKKWLAS